VVTKFAIINRCGFCPEKADKINQDTYIVIENFLKNNRYLFGVFDGHGSNGHYISEFIK
jgi:serine/threonine protein phosphatase PrpC